ncbi:MAG: response regulator receiver protein [Halomonas sp. 54_146]|nr:MULTISPECIES: response regulator [unclassified Halomonas]KUJ88963.1 MAG: response regulator receiver protein [Halomonas sp. 54_146]HAA46738.1 response regulator [Halomonas sp.]
MHKARQAANHVLLVEDDQADAHITQWVFKDISQNRHQGIHLEHCETGESALSRLEACLENSQPLPHLILLDLNMPRMDGFTFLQRIKAHQQLRLIPVVVLTTSNAQSDVRQSYALGAAGYIVKSTSMDAFTRHMQQLTTYWFELVKRTDT